MRPTAVPLDLRRPGPFTADEGQPETLVPRVSRGPARALRLASLALVALGLGAPGRAAAQGAEEPVRAEASADVSAGSRGAAEDVAVQGVLGEPRALTFEGRRSGEGYFSADGRQLVFQSEREPGNPFYQIYLLDLETGETRRVSPGVGKTTCAWMHPSGERVLFASTHLDPAALDKQRAEIEFRESGEQRRYSWDYDPSYDLFAVSVEGGDPVRLTSERGYDAEASYSPDGEWIAFASNRHAFGETLSEEQAEAFEIDPAFMMEIYLMRADGTDVRRLTSTPGYDGGPFFSPDGRRIVWRRFSEDGARAEVYTMALDGSDVRQITELGAMSWAPYYHPSGEYLIFTTNLQGFANFELYVVSAEGGPVVRVTDLDGFDGLPVFAPAGDRLVWTRRPGAGDAGSQLVTASWDHEAARAALAEAQPAPRAAAASEESEPLARLREDVESLADPAMTGRRAGTPGERLATQYVAEAFAEIGLEPAGGGESFFDPFTFTAGISLGEGNEIALALEGEEPASVPAGGEWRPLAFSATGEAEPAPVVFAGYGISAPETEEAAGYDSYAGLDVRDRWVLVLRGLPDDVEPERRQQLARYAGVRHKAMTARNLGARGLIFAAGPRSEFRDPLVPLRFDVSLGESSVFAISVTDAIADRLLAPSGRELGALQDALLEGDVAPGFEIERVRFGAAVQLETERRSARNVVGRLRLGGDSGAPPLVIGAHVDHLGEGAGTDSLAREGERSEIHRGADDNASGVAVLLEVARRLSEGVDAAQRDVLFAAWSAEELGLLGSDHFVDPLPAPRPAQSENPHALPGAGHDGAPGGQASGAASAPAANPHAAGAGAANPHAAPAPQAAEPRAYAAYLNMDMVGRLRERLYVQGVGSSGEWKRLLERANLQLGLATSGPAAPRLSLSEDSYLPTDATSFYLKGIPVLSLFTGSHEEYHTPRDTPDRINYPGMLQVANLVTTLARAVVAREEPIDYVQVQRSASDPGRANIRVYFGTIPSYGQDDAKGVLLSGVAGGSPAAKAGIQADDVIVELAGTVIENIYDYTYALEAVKIGEPVEIVVERGGERVSLEIVPESRQ